MQFGLQCTQCLVARETEAAMAQKDHTAGFSYLKDVLRAIADAPDGVAAPYFTPIFRALRQKYFAAGEDDYLSVKQQSNQWMLARLDRLRASSAANADPVHASLCYARAANYLDFGALRGQIQAQQLDELLSGALKAPLDAEEYRHLLADLSTARHLVYLCDNAGEIAADFLAGQTLQNRYPALQILFVVRGAPALNDALLEDAVQVGMTAQFQVIDNGSGISGTQMGYLSDALQQALAKADIILSKGMGNFETMYGCGLNVYYSFLCKCQRFVHLFNVPMFTGMFLNERRIQLRPGAD